MRFGTMAIYNLGRRRLRSALTALGIAVAVAGFVAMMSLARGLERAWINHLEARGTHLFVMQKGAIEVLTTSIDAEAGDAFRRVEGVEAVAGELIDVMTLEDEETTMAAGWPVGCFLWESLHLQQGRLPTAGEADAVLMGQSAAGVLQKKPGDTVRIRDRDFTVVGVFRMGGVMGDNSVVLPLATMQEMMQRQGKVTIFNLRVVGPADAAQIAAVQARLQAAFPHFAFTESNAATENDMVLRFFRAIAWSVSTMALVISLVVMLNTLMMSVLERTREIGVLSAVGWSSGRIVGLFVTEGLILALVGGVAGLALGIGGLNWVTHLPRVRGFIEVKATPGFLLEVGIVVLVLGVAGSLYPAWRAARLDAVDALRAE
jgi:putative ABC transport system permease protein